MVAQIKIPDACTSETDCEFICTKFVSPEGMSDEAINLESVAGEEVAAFVEEVAVEKS